MNKIISLLTLVLVAGFATSAIAADKNATKSASEKAAPAPAAEAEEAAAPAADASADANKAPK